MKLLTLFMLLTCISVQSLAQTERIAHRSHSGKNSSFHLKGKDNWGIPTLPYENKLKDTAMLVTPDSTTSPKKKIHCRKCKSKARKAKHRN